MKINVLQPLKNFETEEAINFVEEGKSGVPFTVRKAFCQALLFQDPKVPENGEAMLDKYNLATRIKNEDEVELSLNEAKKIKDALPKVYGVNIIGQIFPLLDGK